MKFFHYFLEFVGWVRIVASPLLIAVIAGLIVYFNNPNTKGIVIAAFIVLSGLLVGILWATRIWKKHGTLNFLSRVNASPELDKKED